MLNALDTAYLLGVGRDATYAAFERGELPAIRVGRAWRVPAHRLATEVLGCTVDDIVAALAERTNEWQPDDSPAPTRPRLLKEDPLRQAMTG